MGTSAPAAAASGAGSGWSAQVVADLPGFSATASTRGNSTSFGAGPVSLATDGSSVGVSGALPVLGPVGISGSVDLAKDATTICAGPSIGADVGGVGASLSAQVCYTVPVGYGSALDSVTDFFVPIFGPLADPSTFVDPFSD
jgi:hypothetical protein